MSYLLPHLRTGWAVDQAIINEEERVVCLRFGHDHDVTCMQMDEVLAGIAEDVKNFCAIYVVDVSQETPPWWRVYSSSLQNHNGICTGMCSPLSRRGSGDYPRLFAYSLQVPDFNDMYELYDPCTVMFFFRNKHIMIDLGTGNNNKISWAFNNKQEMIDIMEVVYRGARKGRGLVVSPKDYSTKYKY
ncbi:unnamed protein product [Pylaiella littoralis]